jgi:uncharacterized membrane protein YecN with MAPEG domain
MTGLPVTTFTTAILALVFVVLCVWAVLSRETDVFERPLASRAQANFAEYGPVSLILLGLIELGGGSRALLWFLAIVLIAARIAQPLGLARISLGLLRPLGLAANMAMLVIAALYALSRLV